MSAPPTRTARRVIALALAVPLATVALMGCGSSSSADAPTTSTAAKAKLRKASVAKVSSMQASTWCFNVGRGSPECAYINEDMSQEEYDAALEKLRTEPDLPDE